MPKINLLPKEELDSKPLGKFLKWALSYGRYIIISVEMIVFLVFFSRFIYDRQLADLNDEIEQKQAIIQTAQDFEKRFKTIQKTISYIQTLDQDRAQYLDVLATLERITPLQVSFNEISFSDTDITLEGIAASNEGFAQFLAQMKQVEEFSSVSLDSLSKDEETGDTITFSVTASLEKPELAVSPDATGELTEPL